VVIVVGFVTAKAEIRLGVAIRAHKKDQFVVQIPTVVVSIVFGLFNEHNFI
jgi:hypothetical protein